MSADNIQLDSWQHVHACVVSPALVTTCRLHTYKQRYEASNLGGNDLESVCDLCVYRTADVRRTAEAIFCLASRGTAHCLMHA
jgi:hypothetical protein